MELKDVKTILKRVEINYPKFVNDSYTQSEWYRELKDYDLDDVMGKLENHFRSEQYGNQPPKVYFLTKYLTKTKDKNEDEDYDTFCVVCGKRMNHKLFDEHFDRCSSVHYVLRQYDRFKIPNKPKEEELFKMEQREFDIRYNRLLQYVYKFSSNESEKEIIKKIIGEFKGDE